MATQFFITTLLSSGLLMVVAMGAENASASPRPAKPNVILLLTDDLGWQDVGCYDIDEPCPMETPSIDALSKKGVKFLQAYAPAPTCAPTRCAIMSGNHPARAQKTHVVGGAPPVPHHPSHRMMSPWYSGRMPADEVTLAKVLSKNGYATGHCGKWHMAISHNAYPYATDQGFKWSRHNLGSTRKMTPHRLTGFATDKADDPYQIDENGFPKHQNSEDALEFVRTHKDRPFFLYYATWLVHTPIHTRSKALLDKYCKKLGVELTPENAGKWSEKGQKNPFYCAMVEELDYHVGRLVEYLETTDDPRWPGHKLAENTYLIFTSDNGGMEGHPGEVITDNYPLDRGKISIMEGGIRVPLIITGPGIRAGVESDVMVNGLDFYPTILSLTGTPRPDGKKFDGCDLANLLKKNPGDATWVKGNDGQPRDSLVWHFPNSVALESSIRVGDYKLVRNYDHLLNPRSEALELYRLYETRDGKSIRVDIEEAKNLAAEMPEQAKKLNDRLTAVLSEMKASYPYYNPDCKAALPNKEKIPAVTRASRNKDKVTFTFRENGSKVVRANLIYTLNGGQQYEEWFRQPARVNDDGTVTTVLPTGTTHYLINLIDENNFLVSYPKTIKQKPAHKVPPKRKGSKGKPAKRQYPTYTGCAIPVG